MTQREMVQELARRLGLPQRQAFKALKEMVSIIRGEVQGNGTCRIADLGVFSLRSRKPREVKNWRDGQKFQVPARNGVHFKPSANFKRAVNLK